MWRRKKMEQGQEKHHRHARGIGSRCLCAKRLASSVRSIVTIDECPLPSAGFSPGWTTSSPLLRCWPWEFDSHAEKTKRMPNCEF